MGTSRAKAEDSGGAGNRERILEAACHLFARKGFSATSVRDITQAAGVTNPMVYYYFGSKEALFLAVLEEALAVVLEGTQGLLEGGAGFEETLVRVLVLHFEAVQREPDMARLFVYSQFGPEREQFFEKLSCRTQVVKELLGGVFMRAQAEGQLRGSADVELALLQYFGLIQMPMMQFLAGEEISLDEETARRLVGQLLRGIGAAGATGGER